MADRWRIAIHEAGHCVAARLMGLPVGAASVEPDPCVEFPNGCGKHSVVALMGGALAESLVLGGYDPVGVEVDWARATSLTDELGVDDYGATFELLAAHQGLVERVATGLMDAQMLDQDEIDALLAQ